MALDAFQTCSPAGIRRQDIRQSFGEDPTRATDCHAAEPPRLQLDDDITSLPGKVGQGSGVAAVDLSRLDATQRTWILDRLRRSEDGDKVGPGQDLQNRKTDWDQRQKTARRQKIKPFRALPFIWSPLAVAP